MQNWKITKYTVGKFRSLENYGAKLEDNEIHRREIQGILGNYGAKWEKGKMHRKMALV